MRATPSIVNSPYLSDRSDTPPALSWTPSTPSPAGFSTVPLMLVLRDLPGGSRVGSAGSSHEEIIITASRPAAENDEIKCFMTLYYIAVLGDFLKTSNTNDRPLSCSRNPFPNITYRGRSIKQVVPLGSIGGGVHLGDDETPALRMNLPNADTGNGRTRPTVKNGASLSPHQYRGAEQCPRTHMPASSSCRTPLCKCRSSNILLHFQEW